MPTKTTPAEKPSGFLEVYSTDRKFDRSVKYCFELEPDKECEDYVGEAYWLTIDLSQVSAHAIVKVAS